MPSEKGTSEKGTSEKGTTEKSSEKGTSEKGTTEKSSEKGQLKSFRDSCLKAIHGLNLAWTVLYVPNSRDSGMSFRASLCSPAAHLPCVGWGFKTRESGSKSGEGGGLFVTGLAPAMRRSSKGPLKVSVR